MTSTHTTGPWHWNCDGLYHQGQLYKEYILTASYEYDEGVSVECKNEANARLIATAPDLLEALIDINNICSGACSGRSIEEIARTAIAKAKGDQHA